MRWADPSGPGICPEKYSVASHTESARPASKSDVSMYCPRPEEERQWTAARMAASAKSPAPRSVSGSPAFTGGRPGSPVTDMIPDAPWATEIEPALRRRGPGLPVAGDGGVDEARVLLRERRVVESQARHHAGPVVLDEDVGGACEPPERVARRGLLQVEDDTELAAVDGVERRALGAGRSGHRARGVAAWRLDLDYARPHIAEYHRAVRPGHHLGRVEHNYAVE